MRVPFKNIITMDHVCHCMMRTNYKMDEATVKLLYTRRGTFIEKHRPCVPTDFIVIIFELWMLPRRPGPTEVLCTGLLV